MSKKGIANDILNNDGGDKSSSAATNTNAKTKSEPSSEPGSGVEFTAEQFAELKTRIETLQKERDEYLNLAQRIQADFDNFRKRNACVRAESIDEGERETVKSLIGALDNFERAMKVAEESGECTPFADGVALVYRQFSEALLKIGLTEIEALGTVFDPELHNAIMQVPAQDADSGTVVEVFQKGYKLKDKIVRYAMVKVAQ